MIGFGFDGSYRGMAQADTHWQFPRLSSQAICLNILKFLLVFYSTYYVISSICFAGYRLSNFDGRIPFNFETWIHLPDCCSTYPPAQTVNFISMLLSFAVSGLVCGLVVRHRVWDYALTVTLFHILLSCLVMLKFPLSWSWWVCIAFALVLMIVCGELTALLLRLTLRRKVDNASAPFYPTESASFLYRKM